MKAAAPVKEIKLFELSNRENARNWNATHGIQLHTEKKSPNFLEFDRFSKPRAPEQRYQFTILLQYNTK